MTLGVVGQAVGGVGVLLMAVVFAAFVAGGFSPVKQVGFGLVLAVLLDATVVRMLVVPAFMSLLGPANWWAPPVLRRLHARFGLSDDAETPGGDDHLSTLIARHAVTPGLDA